MCRRGKGVVVCVWSVCVLVQFDRSEADHSGQVTGTQTALGKYPRGSGFSQSDTSPRRPDSFAHPVSVILFALNPDLLSATFL